MARTRISTTVDGALLDRARRLRVGSTDAALLDAALHALVARHRAVEIDTACTAAYLLHPIEAPDDWGDLASFRNAAAQS